MKRTLIVLIAIASPAFAQEESPDQEVSRLNRLLKNSGNEVATSNEAFFCDHAEIGGGDENTTLEAKGEGLIFDEKGNRWAEETNVGITYIYPDGRFTWEPKERFESVPARTGQCGIKAEIKYKQFLVEILGLE